MKRVVLLLACVGLLAGVAAALVFNSAATASSTPSCTAKPNLNKTDRDVCSFTAASSTVTWTGKLSAGGEFVIDDYAPVDGIPCGTFLSAVYIYEGTSGTFDLQAPGDCVLVISYGGRIKVSG